MRHTGRSLLAPDPRLPVTEVRGLAAVAARWLAGAAAAGLVQAVLLVVQAAVLSRLLANALYGGLTARTAGASSLGVALLALGQGLMGWAWEAFTETAAQRARTATRQRALTAALRLAASGQPGISQRLAAAGLQNTDDRRTAPGQLRRGENGGILGPGGLATLIGSGIDELNPFVGRVLPRAVLALAVPALLLAWIARMDLASAGMAGVALALAPLLAGLVGADTAVAVRRRLAGLERLGDRFAALVDGLPLLRAFGRAGDHERAVAVSGEEVRAATLAALRIALLAGLVLELLAAVGTALVALRLGLRLDSGTRILPQALAVLMLTPEVFLPVRRLTADFHAGAVGRSVLARLTSLAAGEAVAARPPGQPAAPGGQRAAGEPAPQYRSREPLGVVLEGVCLAAEGRSEPLLDRIDLRVSPGERLCVTGPSGSGKSSLLRVVAGLVPPSAGRSCLEDTSQQAAPPALGWVPQHPTILPASVMDNVALGRPGVGERDVRAALEAVQLWLWLGSLPHGLATALSGLDTPLSLGERRRLAVARCLAGPRPRLWLLDEPTAGLDSSAAERLAAELGRVIDGVTAIIATHDPSAMILGHRTVELCRGRIRGAGPGKRGSADASPVPGR